MPYPLKLHPPRTTEVIIGPQPGPQTEFVSSSVDVVIFGGSAGGGKTYSFFLDLLKYFEQPKFRGVVFRRKTPMITNSGGLLSKIKEMFIPLGCRVLESSPARCIFPMGGSFQISHMESEDDRHSWDGAELDHVVFDELQDFTEKQFWYMFSRLRGSLGGSGRMRGLCNPNPDSFIRKLIDWWIGPDGYAIPERSGKIRFFCRREDTIIWADKKSELVKQGFEKDDIKSFTFIRSSVEDNPIMMERNPGYIANLNALPTVERQRLRWGNWDIRPAAGLYFRREMFKMVDVAPADLVLCRYWDRASTEESQKNEDPDWTAGTLMGKDSVGRFYIVDIRRFRGTPAKVETSITNVAMQDGQDLEIIIEQDPGSAGVAEASYYVRRLAGFTVHLRSPTKSKELRARPMSSQAEAGNIYIVRGAWNEEFFVEAENFGGGKGHDDQIDACSGAFNFLCEKIEYKYEGTIEGSSVAGHQL